MILGRALAVTGALLIGSSVASPLADAQGKAAEWLKAHYSAQERGECLSSSCPVAKGWKLMSIASTPDAIVIAFSSPRPAPQANLQSFRAMPAQEKENTIRTLCPYAGFEVWQILPANYVIRVSVSDAAAGLIGEATCSRRITY